MFNLLQHSSSSNNITVFTFTKIWVFWYNFKSLEIEYNKYVKSFVVENEMNHIQNVEIRTAYEGLKLRSSCVYANTVFIVK